MSSVAAVVVEDEPIHELYASLVENPISRHYSHSLAKRKAEALDVASLETTAACIRSQTNTLQFSDNRRGNHQHSGATIIPLDDQTHCSKEPTSQFIQFYRKSCQSQQQYSISGEIVDAKKQSANHKTQPSSRNSSSPSIISQFSSKNYMENNYSKKSEACCNKKCSSSTKSSITKAERRRIAKREREEQIQTDKRIRFLLHSDFSEHDYKLLYIRFPG